MKMWRVHLVRPLHRRPEIATAHPAECDGGCVEAQVLRATLDDYERAHAALVDEIIRLRNENRSLRGLWEDAQIKISKFTRALFGRKSERQRSETPRTKDPDDDLEPERPLDESTPDAETIPKTAGTPPPRRDPEDSNRGDRVMGGVGISSYLPSISIWKRLSTSNGVPIAAGLLNGVGAQPRNNWITSSGSDARSIIVSDIGSSAPVQRRSTPPMPRCPHPLTPEPWWVRSGR